MNDARVLDWLDSPEGEKWLNGQHRRLMGGVLVGVKSDDPIIGDHLTALLWYI